VGLIDYIEEIYDIATENGIIVKGGGGMHSYKGETIKGQAQVKERLNSDPEFIRSVYQDVKNI
jgi:hypothetical protein